MRGLQGDGPKYLKAAAWAKHCAVHTLYSHIPVNKCSASACLGIRKPFFPVGSASLAAVYRQKDGAKQGESGEAGNERCVNSAYRLWSRPDLQANLKAAPLVLR